MDLKKIAKNLWWTINTKTINDMPDSIVFVNNKGIITKYNKRAKEVFAITETEEKSTIEFDEIVKDGLSYIKTSLQNSKPVLATAIANGKEFYVELNVSGNKSGYCVIIRDMTKLTAEIFNEDKTLRFNNEKNAMLSKIESDLISPVTSISGFSQGLLDGLGGELTEKQVKYVKIINSNAEDLHHFLDKLLEFSAVESSIYESDYHNFDIVETFKAIIKDCENEISEKKLEFEFDYETLEKRTVYTDFNAIKRIFRNILEVAISMTENGSISVKLAHPDEIAAAKYNPQMTAEQQKSFVQITIKDTGIGVADEDMRYLCEPYAQLEKGKKNFLRALKLGSASILTKRANGIIGISSEIMRGTKYEIIIPTEKV
ncbi:MAG: PAS domain-containing sensor histidine kinase [Cyanobacteria bacterium SIG26]|nr:PAS domain-containing sensor histidine kinase [Cyanobacteria bacterium SIG26]